MITQVPSITLHLRPTSQVVGWKTHDMAQVGIMGLVCCVAALLFI